MYMFNILIGYPEQSQKLAGEPLECSLFVVECVHV